MKPPTATPQAASYWTTTLPTTTSPTVVYWTTTLPTTTAPTTMHRTGNCRGEAARDIPVGRCG